MKPTLADVLIDAEDRWILDEAGWRIQRAGHTWYVERRVRVGALRVTERLHRRVAGLATGDVLHVDHKDGNGLDNRRGNLRVCTREQNMRNSRTRSHNASGLKGVSLQKGRYTAHIRQDGKKRHLGTFPTAEAAHAAYCEAARGLHGDFFSDGVRDAAW